jgi:hypothetical protein
MKIKPFLLHLFLGFFIFTSTSLHAEMQMLSNSTGSTTSKSNSMFKEEKPMPSIKMPAKKAKKGKGGKKMTAAQKREAAIAARQAKLDKIKGKNAK